MRQLQWVKVYEPGGIRACYRQTCILQSDTGGAVLGTNHEVCLGECEER